MQNDNETELERVLNLCRLAKQLGTSLVVTNPDPVNWNNTPKPDPLVRIQTESLEHLGSELRALGMVLAYHFHTSELLNGAKELHHTFQRTSFDNVKLCFDAHWAYRGCGNSQLAVEDLIHMYGSRIVSLHLRQSRDGIWTETLCDGDIDYRFLFDYLDANDWNGLTCIELATEAGTSLSLSLGQAHLKSKAWLESVWPKASKRQGNDQG